MSDFKAQSGAKLMISKDSSKNKGGKKGNLPAGDEDRVLWDHVTQDVKKLRSSKSKDSVVPPTPASLKKIVRQSAPAVVAPVKMPARVPGDQEVDRRTDQKLKRGQYPVDLTLDLHGLTQAAAQTKLLETLRRGQARGLRCVLVITGKGRGEGQGVLRRQVPLWLADESLRSVVLRSHTAQPEHGGTGALYVLLRRKRMND